VSTVTGTVDTRPIVSIFVVYGCDVRDSSGNLQAASCHVEFLMADPVVGEVLAALHTVEFCRDKGFSLIVLEGDSLLVVQAINNTRVNWSRIGLIIDDIPNILKGFKWRKICHTKQQGNKAAHTLACTSRSSTGFKSYLD
jgi:ribonuclease HI